MGNISNRLKGLFNDYLARIEEEKHRVTVSTYDYRNRTTPPPPPMYNDDDYNGIIYFYEWSDITRPPKSYYTLHAFENFLMTCQIYMASYEKELIKHIHSCYIACSKDGKKLLIKCSYDSLKHALETEDRPSNPFRPIQSNKPLIDMRKGSEDKEPYSVAITRAPSVDNSVKVLNSKVYPPNAPKSLIQRPPMYEPNGRWDSREEMQDALGGIWGW